MAQNVQATTSTLPQTLGSQRIDVTTSVALYTVPAATSAVVRHGVLCNVSGQNVGISSSLLSTGAPITSLPVGALATALGSGAQVVITSGANTQTWTLTSAATSGATSLAVASQTPNFAYPSGSIVSTAALSALVTLSLVPSGGAADGTHVLIHKYSLASGDSLSLSGYLAGAQMGSGDSIYVTSLVPSVVTAVVTGLVST